jgi:Domain of unknown function DUF1828
MTSPCQVIAQQIGELFVCTPHDRYTRIRTPYLYPDGDVIDLFLRQNGDVSTLTDLGETLRWFRMQTPSLRRSPKQRQIIEDVCLNHGVELFRGMLVIRVDSERDLGPAVTRLSQAALRVSDLWFSVRNRAVQSITDEVADFLTEKEIRYERSEKIPGRSGRIWPVDFHTWTPNRSSLVYVLSTGSRASAKSIVEHVVASWYDMSHMKVGPQPLGFVSLFDDTLDIWSDEDLRLAGQLSDVSRWSRPDEFESVLRAAA